MENRTQLGGIKMGIGTDLAFKEAQEKSVLGTALQAVYSERCKDYGDPDIQFQTHADLINNYLRARGLLADGASITSADVGFISILGKISRAIHGKTTRDTLADIGGYALTISMVLGMDPNPGEVGKVVPVSEAFDAFGRAFMAADGIEAKNLDGSLSSQEGPKNHHPDCDCVDCKNFELVP